MKITVVGGLVPALALAIGIGTARAQDFDIGIVNEGKPAAGVEVLLLVNSGKVELGTTVEDGLVQVPDRSDLAAGTPVDVYAIECDDEVVIVIVGPGEQAALEEECERRRRENPNCTCRRIGGFMWGDDVTIDVGTDTVTQAETADDMGSTGIGNFTLGVAFDLRQMLDLEDVAGQANGVTNASATTWAPGFQIFGEYLFLGFLAAGIEAAYSRMETETQLQLGVLTGQLDYYEIGGTAKLGPPTRGPVWPYVIMGLYHGWNHADFEQDGLSDHRLHKTGRVGLGAGLYYWAALAWGLRFEGLYNTTFEDGDADEHIRWKLGLMFRPFSQERY
ncbi:MAG: hypothetical protein ACREK2_02765 [Gemmatimonadota bacterium]